MKVLHVLNELMASGAEGMLRCSVSYWHKGGVQGEILSTGKNIGPFALQLKKAGYPIHHIRFRKDPFFFLAFFNLIKKGKYDLVHIHCERAAFYYGLFARLAGARIIRTIHGVFAFRGNLAFRRRLQRNILRALGCTSVSISGLVKRIEQHYFSNPSVVISDWYDSDRFLIPSKQERAEARRKYEVAKEIFVVTSIGSCGDVKNHPALLEALAMVCEDLNFIYLHAGNEKPGYPERDLAQKLGISERVRFLGFINDTRSVLHAADVFVMPSLSEGFGIAAVEAMATGVSSILSENIGSLHELQGIRGIWSVRPESSSIADAMLRVAELRPEDRSILRNEMHRKVKSLYGIERGVRAYKDIYKDCLGTGD